jgi:hypothetical protein
VLLLDSGLVIVPALSSSLTVYRYDALKLAATATPDELKVDTVPPKPNDMRIYSKLMLGDHLQRVDRTTLACGSRGSGLAHSVEDGPIVRAGILFSGRDQLLLREARDRHVPSLPSLVSVASSEADRQLQDEPSHRE